MPTSSLWSFTGATLTGTAAALGIEGVTLHRNSNRTDKVTFNTPGRAVDAAPLFAYRSTVTLSRDGVPWFVGLVTRVPSDGDGRAEGQSYELSGPWWYLENLVCRQEWHVQGGPTLTALSTHLILGQAADGSLLTTGGVITEALTYAIDNLAPLAVRHDRPRTSSRRWTRPRTSPAPT